MLKGYKTIITGFALTVAPVALTYLAQINWADYMTPQAAFAVSGVLMIALRLVTTTPVGNSSNTALKALAFFLIVAGGTLAMTAIAMAEPLKLHVTGNPVRDVQADIRDANGNRIDENKNPADAIIATAKAQGDKLITDLQRAHELASYKDASGNEADIAAAQCYAALLPVVQLVVHGPLSAADSSTASQPQATPTAPLATPPEAQEDGVVTRIEKLRIIRLALQSTSLKNSCAALVQDVQSQVASVITGAAGIARVLSGVGLALP